MQLNSTTHHSSPQSDDAQALSPVAPIGSLGLLLHGSTSCQKYDSFTFNVTDRRFVQRPAFVDAVCFLLFYPLPTSPPFQRFSVGSGELSFDGLFAKNFHAQIFFIHCLFTLLHTLLKLILTKITKQP